MRPPPIKTPERTSFAVAALKTPIRKSLKQPPVALHVLIAGADAGINKIE